MKSNIVLKIVAVAIVAILGVVLLKGKGAKAPQSVHEGSQNDYDLSALESVESGPVQEDNGLVDDYLSESVLLEQHGVDIDTPVETMRTLTEQTKAVREDSTALQKALKTQSTQVDQLLDMESKISKKVNASLKKEAASVLDKAKQEFDQEKVEMQSMISDLVKKVEVLTTETQNPKRGPRSAGGYEIGDSGIPTGLGYDEDGREVDFDEIVWSIPMDAVVDYKNPTEITLPEFGGDTSDALQDLASATAKGKSVKEDRLIKAYTIPENATLLGSVSMTALLGRIPTKGKVVDPYPFKIVIGPENLSSNGIHIPGVMGVKMSGIAKGDWTLSCVSGDITSMTFTFEDGTIRTIPEPGSQKSNPIAWFSDRYGTPCVTGERITNAVSYLSQRVGLSAAEAYARADAEAQFTTQSADGTITRALTGDPQILARNTAITGGVSEVSDWLDDRQENSFDAIYVPPGTEVELHITSELKIDYDPDGRKVNHYAKLEPRSKHHLD